MSRGQRLGDQSSHRAARRPLVPRHAAVMIAIGGVLAPRPAAIAKVRIPGIADRPTTIVVVEGVDGGGRGHFPAWKTGLYRRGRRTRGRAPDSRIRLRRGDPLATGSADRARRRWAIASGQAHAMNLANHRVSTDAAKFPRDLAGALARHPHRLQVNDSVFGPAFGFWDSVGWHRFPQFLLQDQGVPPNVQAWLTTY